MLLLTCLYHLGSCPVTCIVLCTLVSFLNRKLAIGQLLAVLERCHRWHDYLAQRVKHIQWVGVCLVRGGGDWASIGAGIGIHWDEGWSH